MVSGQKQVYVFYWYSYNDCILTNLNILEYVIAFNCNQVVNTVKTLNERVFLCILEIMGQYALHIFT